MALGDADNLRIIEADVPRAQPGQILVRTEAAGIIFADVPLRRGSYVHHPSVPIGRAARSSAESLKWATASRGTSSATACSR